MPKKSLAETHPELAMEWHPTRNGELTPNDFTGGSHKKVWWKCPKGDDHEWETSLTNRTRLGRNCTICSNQKIVNSNCLATTHPKLASQWHPTLNGNLTPSSFPSGSGKKVWWKCDKGDDHEWESRINHITNGSGCPICSGRKVVESNCLATTHTELAKEWHPTLNGNLTPKDVVSGTAKKVWWKCDKGDDHEWKAPINQRASGSACSICSNRKTVESNSLAITHPLLAKEWHPTLNGNLTPFDVMSGSHKKVWWKCDKGDDHEWKTSCVSRKIGGGCSICSSHKTVESNSLAITHPLLAKEWHPSLNGNLTPFEFQSGSHKKVWWKCDKGDDHEWKASIYSRADGKGCSICWGRTVVKSNCIATTHPKLAKQWHPTKNGNLTPNDVTGGSHKKVWWKCDKGDDHEWKTTMSDRSNGRDCPFCTLTPQSKQELTITFELIKLFKNINPKGLKTKLDGRLRAIDIFIPKLNLCIEFDGAYWHKEKRDIDKIKSEMLFEEGFKLIRVREEPLKKIYDTDVTSKKPYNGKQVTNDILSMIMSIFELDAKLVSKIKEYQSKDGLQNEKGLEKYIDKILTEKAEKK